MALTTKVKKARKGSSRGFSLLKRTGDKVRARQHRSLELAPELPG
jgi:hypothetical protein